MSPTPVTPGTPDGRVARLSVLRGLALACHPAPTVVVTLAVTVLAAGAGRDAAGCALVLVTVLVGQLSVGWSNDGLDAGRDAASRRTDKPTVRGLVGARALLVAAFVALAVAVALSFVAAGAAGGLCHVVFLASAWTYNLGVKRTRFSLVPYAVGFGALPGFVTYGLDPSRAPAGWFVATGALLGVAAGLANAAPDVEDDRATGVHGAVGLIGADAARTLCLVTMFVATVTLTTGADFTTGAVVAAILVVAVLGGVGARVRDGRYLFPMVLVIALFDVTLLALAL